MEMGVSPMDIAKRLGYSEYRRRRCLKFKELRITKRKFSSYVD